MASRPPVLTALLSALALVAAGCGAAPDDEPPQAAAAPEGSWQLVSGSGPDGAIEPLESHPVTLTFEEDGRVGGTAACNSYGAEARIEGDRLELDELASTEMACEPPEVMEVEAAYLGALQRVDRVESDGERLVLTGPGVELRFEPLPPVPAEALLGTTWELETVLRGDTASTPAAPGATLRLDPDGALEGHTGCRAFAGEYELRGGEVRVTRLELEGDTGACEAAAAEQDALVASVVGDGFRAEVDGDRLALRAAGEDGLHYRPRGG